MQNYKNIMIAFVIYIASLLLITHSLQGKDFVQFLFMILASITYLIYVINEDKET